MFDPIEQLSIDNQVTALWGRVADHLGFLHRMHKTNKQVLQAIIDGEPDTAKFLLIAIMSDWEDHVEQRMEPGV